eukprot:CAMPEP_0117666988 /NCGR_PEP_ID=MMETSP0804-20121206/10695_1 /TAXON_ID=1074897 /ORGANISM="Tetraselmis astigmatica, Strain CCMP880" /LENGTH=606 /DNA_ID=CAMNT_0005474621 /DNA_START=100 /DNA_END=1920 /DNA_ORIENTATION=-
MSLRALLRGSSARQLGACTARGSNEGGAGLKLRHLSSSPVAQAEAATAAAAAHSSRTSEAHEGGGGGGGLKYAAAALAAAGLGYAAYTQSAVAPSDGGGDDLGGAHIVNWSGTHEVAPKQLHQPETVEELEQIVAAAQKEGRKLRAMGSALSPNGLSFCEESMVSLGLLDKVLNVDEATGQVRVQAGARVQDVVEALRPYGLTLQNYASIREQQIGGFTQVGAHGTGAAIPPVDEQVVAMKIVTPGQGTVELSATENPELFYVARCGLGALGAVAEVTLQCVPAHRLVETTWVATMAEIKKNHARWLRGNKHIRYMWIPYTDTVVVVANNPVGSGSGSGWGWLPTWLGGSSTHPKVTPSTSTEEEKVAALRELLMVEGRMGLSAAEIDSKSVAQLRDELVAIAPLEPEWIARVNKAEAEYWKLNSGIREGWSDEMLGFDCGGQQWVLEVAFPTGTLDRPSFADIAYMEQLLKQIETSRIPAPSPIEQRWTSASASPMSPAYSQDKNSVFSWVGIIMYLPDDDAQQRAEITSRFHDYTKMAYTYLVPQYGAVEHWAKIEVPNDVDGREQFQARLKARYPVGDFNAARCVLDPKNIMSNHIVEKLFPL